MFEQLQELRWYRKRPQRSGFLALTIACAVIFIYAWVQRIVHKRDAISIRNSSLLQEEDRPVGSKRGPDVVIITTPLPFNKIIKSKRSPLKCRCHIDTQAPGQPVVHHDTQFAICQTMQENDKAWNQGSYFRTTVQIRWHCIER